MDPGRVNADLLPRDGHDISARHFALTRHEGRSALDAPEIQALIALEWDTRRGVGVTQGSVDRLAELWAHELHELQGSR